MDNIEKELILKRYDIHIEGYVTRKRDGSIVVFSKDFKGYLKARLLIPELSKNKDRRKPYRLHRIIACFYIPNPLNKPQVNHKNGIKIN